jgi:hypothetical protein
LLTDRQMYYGSSNFTNASWRDRVEVISLHDHVDLNSWWSKRTIRDFKEFLNDEIRSLNDPRRRMATYPGLLTATRNAWNSLKTLIQRLNPSIEKVVQTLNNYDKAQGILKEQVVNWFDHHNKNYFQTIVDLSSDITISLDLLCEYAYANIYNEIVNNQDVDLSTEVINEYNRLHKNTVTTIDLSIEQLPTFQSEQEIQSETSITNLNRINEIQRLINQYLKDDKSQQ